MDQIIDIKSFKPLNSSLKDREVIKTIRLLAVFGNFGQEVIFATNEDKVFGFGQNKSGCLGLSIKEQDIREPKLNRTLSGKGLKDIVFGFEHCIGLTTDGKCYAWGHNDYGRLGIGTYDSTPTPLQIKELDKQCIVQIACGISHSLALNIDGQLFSWGRNNWGQLGIGNYKSRYFPNLVDIPFKVIGMACGRNHSMALTDTKQVFVWGFNDSGQLGIHPNCTKRNFNEKPSLCKPQVLTNLSKNVMLAKVVCGPNHSLILTTNGWIYAFGDNAFGQVGEMNFEKKFNPNRLDNGVVFKDIIASNQNDLTIAVSEDNKCYFWGTIDQKIMAQLQTDALPPGLSVFDIYVKLAKYEITFKTIVINENNQILNAIKCTVLKTNGKAFVNINQMNSLLKKTFNNQINPKPFERKEQNKGNVVIFEQKKTQKENIETNDENNNRLKKTRNEEQIGTENKARIETQNKSRSERQIETKNVGTQTQTQTNSYEMANIETNSVNSLNSDDYFSFVDTFSRSGLKFHKLLSEAFDKQNYSDLRFVFCDQNVIYCHKTILKIRNQKFWQNCCRSFTNTSNNQKPIRETISIFSYSYASFYAFLKYLYGFEPELDTQIVCDVLKLAQIFEEQEMADLCYQYILNNEDSLNAINICGLYEKAVEYGLSQLKIFCIQFVEKLFANRMPFKR